MTLTAEKVREYHARLRGKHALAATTNQPVTIVETTANAIVAAFDELLAVRGVEPLTQEEYAALGIPWRDPQ